MFGGWVLAGVVGGLVGGTAMAAPAVPLGADALSAGLEVADQHTWALAGRPNPVLQQRFTLEGIPVRRAFVTAIDEAAGPRVVAQVLPSQAPQLRPSDASVDAATAVAHATAHWQAHLVQRGTPVPQDIPPPDGELVYLLILGEPVLAYEVDLPLTLGAEPSRLTVWVSAHSGIVLDEWEHVMASKARVFLTNPAVTPEPIEVTLSGIDALGAGHPLVGDRIQSLNCTVDPPDDPESMPPWHKDGNCYPLQRVVSDANGNYFPPLPNVLLPEDNADGDDEYAELSMYWHAERFLDRMSELGVDEFKCDFSTMIANYREAKLSPSYPDLPHIPVNNAYWTNTCDPDKGPTMIFGQGSSVDFGYDGDVVYHELGHGMVSMLTPAGLGHRRPRGDGQVNDAGGINEAIADYFSVMLTSEPLLGDYVARFWPGYGSSIRTAENTKTCPSDTVGQVHNDGEPFMGALWSARKRVGAELLDPLVIELLTRLPVDADLETASWTLLELAEDDNWSPTDLEHLIRAFDARGIYGCDRVITDPARVSSGRSMYLRQRGTAAAPFLPGPMQLRHEVPVGTDNVIIRFRQSGDSGIEGNPAGVVVLVKREDAPIEFTYTLTAFDRAGEGVSKPSVREVINVSGDWDLETSATFLGGSDHQLILRGYRPGEVVHVALANLRTSELAVSGVSVLSLPTEFLDDGVVHEQASGAADEAELDAQIATGDAVSSCSCNDSGNSGVPLLGLVVLGLGLRRRTSRPRRPTPWTT